MLSRGRARITERNSVCAGATVEPGDSEESQGSQAVSRRPQCVSVRNVIHTATDTVLTTSAVTVTVTVTTDADTGAAKRPEDEGWDKDGGHQSGG